MASPDHIGELSDRGLNHSEGDGGSCAQGGQKRERIEIRGGVIVVDVYCRVIYLTALVVSYSGETCLLSLVQETASRCAKAPPREQGIQRAEGPRVVIVMTGKEEGILLNNHNEREPEVSLAWLLYIGSPRRQTVRRRIEKLTQQSQSIVPSSPRSLVRLQ